METLPYFGTQAQLDEARDASRIILEQTRRFNSLLYLVAFRVTEIAGIVREIQRDLDRYAVVMADEKANHGT
jgi:hypothetical protein